MLPNVNSRKLFVAYFFPYNFLQLSPVMKVTFFWMK